MQTISYFLSSSGYLLTTTNNIVTSTFIHFQYPPSLWKDDNVRIFQTKNEKPAL